jgi:hypothetical protein
MGFTHLGTSVKRRTGTLVLTSALLDWFVAVARVSLFDTAHRCGFRRFQFLSERSCEAWKPTPSSVPGGSICRIYDDYGNRGALCVESQSQLVMHGRED